jgi:DNA (cytosine-5)-methyltransferase 1
MKDKPKLLDLFSGAGGAAYGYKLAGFHITGVDKEPQPRYAGDIFIQADALDYVREFGHLYDAIHASPPCQFNLKGLNAVNESRGRINNHVDLIAETREAVIKTNLPFVIENIVGSALIHPIQLCGSSFGLPVKRHRLFESNLLLFALCCQHHIWKEAIYPTNFRPKGEIVKSKVVQVYGNTAGSKLWNDAMKIDWMDRKEIQQAIPPAYTQYIGRFLFEAI